MRSRSAEVGLDIVQRRFLASGQVEGKGGEDFAPAPSVAHACLAGAPLMLAHQRQSKLAGEELVIGEPGKLGRRWFEVGRAASGMMDAGDALGERRPSSLPAKSRIEPFRQRRNVGDRLADRANERLRRQTGGHRIDRLDQRQAARHRPR
jgi:hypothetical protein